MPDSKISALPNPLTVTTLATNDKVPVYDQSTDSLTTAQVDAIAARQSYPLWDGTNWDFNQSSAPTTRPGGGALGIGDTWTERNNSTNAIAGFWMWNGTYWLSQQMFSVDGNGNGVASFNAQVRPYAGTDLYLETVSVIGKTSASNTGTAYHQLNLYRFDSDGSNTQITANLFNTSAIAANLSFSKVANINSFYSVSEVPSGQASPAFPISYFVQMETGAGAPGNIPRANLFVQYRRVRK